MSEEQKNTAPSSTKKQRGPNTVELEKRIDELEKQVDNLVACLQEVATLTGQGNYLVKYGYKRHDPSINDMRKYKE